MNLYYYFWVQDRVIVRILISLNEKEKTIRALLTITLSRNIIKNVIKPLKLVYLKSVFQFLIYKYKIFTCIVAISPSRRIISPTSSQYPTLTNSYIADPAIFSAVTTEIIQNNYIQIRSSEFICRLYVTKVTKHPDFTGFVSIFTYRYVPMFQMMFFETVICPEIQLYRKFSFYLLYYSNSSIIFAKKVILMISVFKNLLMNMLLSNFLGGFDPNCYWVDLATLHVT